MIPLIIISVIVCLCLLALFGTVSLDISFDEDFLYKVKFLGITVYKSKAEEKNKDKNQKQKGGKSGKKKKSLFSRFKKKYGFVGAVKEFFIFFKDVLLHTKQFRDYIKFRKVCLDVSVAGGDAAKTAFDYGLVCTAAYPVLSFVETITDLEYKSINIKSDFESNTSKFTFSALVKSKLFFLLKIAFAIYKDYQKFIARIETNE